MRRTDGYAPLRQYLATGDGRSVALIAADGAVDWLAVPQLDHPPVWSALLDPERGGRLELAPSEPFDVTREYLGPTNVVATTFATASGTVRVTDSLNSGLAGRLPWTEFARRIDGVAGSVPMRWRVSAGRALDSSDAWIDPQGRAPLLGSGATTMALILDGVGNSEVSGAEYRGSFRADEGSRSLLAVAGGAGEPLHLPRPADVQNRIDLSIDAWRTWSAHFGWNGPWPGQVLRSALALKLLLYSPTGAIAAAATTSVPEGLGGRKNWDYRFTWVRDTAYTIDAFVRCGMHEEVHAALAWLLNTVNRHGPGLQPFHTLHGDLPAGKQECPVPGYRNSPPVVSGNDAECQLQLGPVGDLFQAVYLSVRQSHRLDGRTRHLLTGMADRCVEQWREPDSGMWELHHLRHFTISKMSCWQALDRAAELADLGELPGDAQRWRTEAERIRAWVHEHCWSPTRGAYLMHPEADDLDAGVLLGARFGFDRGEKMRSTIDAVRAELGVGPALYRYTGMAAEEGAFIACTFWAVEALALTGRRDEAVQLMDEMLAFLGGVDLLAEMVDPDSGEYLGNLPQALSHLAMINAAAAVADAP